MKFYSKNNTSPIKTPKISFTPPQTSTESYGETMSVSEVNELIKNVLDNHLTTIYLKAEISSFSFHSSGHIYLTLKDLYSVIDGIVFKNFVCEEHRDYKIGDTVIVKGTIALYLKGGKYSLHIQSLRRDGQGALYQNFLDLKDKLEKEHLFDEDRKKALPERIQKIALITSDTGAALKDFLEIASQRTKSIEYIIIPTLMQGKETAISVMESLSIAEKIPSIDIVVITRGGGAYEDLEPFNDEKLARAISECPLPIVSAIGHERDFTICDFVADKRASTPSHAAEILTTPTQVIQDKLNHYKDILYRIMMHKIESLKNQVYQNNPLFLYKDLLNKLTLDKNYLHQLYQTLSFKMDSILENKNQQLKSSYNSLLQLNPLAILSKGYAFVENQDKKPVFSTKQLSQKEKLVLYFKDGKVTAQISDIDAFSQNDKPNL